MTHTLLVWFCKSTDFKKNIEYNIFDISSLLKKTLPMMHKYPAESKPYKKQSLPNPSSVQFILNYSKAFEVKKLKKRKILVCKN